MVKVTCLLAKAGSGLGFRFGDRTWTEMKIRCVKGMYMLKLMSDEKIQGLKAKGISKHLSSITPSQFHLASKS